MEVKQHFSKIKNTIVTPCINNIITVNNIYIYIYKQTININVHYIQNFQTDFDIYANKEVKTKRHSHTIALLQ